MSEIEWSGPPPETRGGPNAKYAETRAALAERPGEWAVIDRRPHQPGAWARNISRGKSWVGYEVAQRKIDGQDVLYARFVGVEAGA